MKLASFNPYAVGFLSFGTIIAVVAAIWTFYPSDTTDPSFLPVIQASSQPVRIEPSTDSDTGFANNNESRIYETFKAGQNPPRIENLLSVKDATEQTNIPSREELFAGLKPEINVRAPQLTDAEESNTDVVSITESPFGDNTASEPIMAPNKIAVIKEQTVETMSETAPPKPTYIPVQKPKPIDEPQAKAVPGVFARNTTPKEITSIEPAAGVSAAPKAELAKIAPQQTFKSGNYFVQLASIQDSAKTQKAWRDLTQQYSVLQSASYRTQNASIAGKGTFYRIQAGPFSKASAENLCAQIKSQSGSCFVTSK